MPKPLKKTPLLEHLSLNPLVISQDAAELFQASVTHLEGDEHGSADINRAVAAVNAAANDNEFWGDGSADDWRSYYRPYNVVNGVLQIPIMGVLLDRLTLQLGRWATGYKYIEMALKRGLLDGSVLAIALVIDSPGGEVSGCFELCEKIFAARGEKPIRAFAANSAYSAAYALASSASKISVAKSGGVGSIGVVTSHVSYADAMEKLGIKVTFIFAGDHKVDGNVYQDLPKAVKDRIQLRINKIYGIFTSTVAEQRGMDEDDVIATQALTYDADEAIEIGLADSVGSLEEEMAIFADEANADQGDEFMAVQGNVTGQKPGGDNENGIDQATYDKGVADAKAAGINEGVATGKAEGAKAERARISGILASEEAKDKPKAAMNVAMKSDMSLDDAKAFLTDMPTEQAAATTTTAAQVNGKNEARNHFQEAMDNGQQPNITASEGGDGDKSEKTDSNSILASFGAASGFGPMKKSA